MNSLIGAQIPTPTGSLETYVDTVSHLPILSHEQEKLLAHRFQQQGDLEKALKLVKHAVDAEPNNDAYLDSLGWVHFHLGNLTRAEAYILRALSFEPDDPEKLEHLGYIYEAQGKLDEARRTWSRAMRGYPSGYRRLLDKLDPP